jgi:hypothetical protein
MHKGININISIPMPEGEYSQKMPEPMEAPAPKKIRLKKKPCPKKDSPVKKEEVIDGVVMGDTLMRHLLPDMNSKLRKS